MFKNLLFVLVAAPLFFASCKKSEDSNEFIINGVTDVNLGSATANKLTLAVTQTTGSQLPVTLTVTGLPAGITADIQPASGTPNFASVITFNQGSGAVAGTYPIHVVGTSSSYSRTYDLNLIVPAFNGFIFDGVRYSKSSIQHATNSYPPPYGDVTSIMISSFDNGSATVTAYFMGAFPADGTYNFHVGGSSKSSLALMYSNNATGTTFYDGSDTTKPATLIVSGGKLTLQIDNAPLEDGSSSGGATKTLVVNTHE